MKTVLFVHGTGVRDRDYRSSLEKIRDGLGEPRISSLKIEGCLWGDPLGTKLRAPAATCSSAIYAAFSAIQWSQLLNTGEHAILEYQAKLDKISQNEEVMTAEHVSLETSR
jgi:hypothetical protein